MKTAEHLTALRTLQSLLNDPGVTNIRVGSDGVLSYKASSEKWRRLPSIDPLQVNDVCEVFIEASIDVIELEDRSFEFILPGSTLGQYKPLDQTRLFLHKAKGLMRFSTLGTFN